MHCVAAADVADEVLVVQGVGGTWQLGTHILQGATSARQQLDDTMYPLTTQSELEGVREIAFNSAWHALHAAQHDAASLRQQLPSADTFVATATQQQLVLTGKELALPVGE